MQARSKQHGVATVSIEVMAEEKKNQGIGGMHIKIFALSWEADRFV